jgi:glutathione S-transferase
MVLFASSAVYFPGLGIRRNTDAHIVFVTGIQFDGTAYHAARDRRRFREPVISFAKREQHASEYLKLNPEGKVPILLVDGHPLTEVAATLYYLARRFPEADLFPEGDLEAEAQVVSWMSFIASTIHPARRIGVERWREVFEIAEKRLARKDWAAGGYSIADIHLFRLFWRFFTTLHPAADAYPGLFAHYERMMARPAVKKTIEIEAAVGYQLPQ